MKWWIIVLALVAVGCRPSASVAVVEQETPEVIVEPSPEELLYDQLAAGSFSFAAGVRTMEQVRQDILKLQEATRASSLREALEEAGELLDSAASSVADHSVDPPPLSDIGERFGHYDDQRLAAIVSGNDALHELRSLVGMLDSLIEDHPSHKEQLASLRQRILSAKEDLASGMGSLGGEIEDPEDSG